MTQKRVKFDFRIEFTNGGGLQGQDFRLDIEGEDITDEELAAYIIRDLNLLMVGEVKVMNKEIILEAHKRIPPAKGELSTELVDLRTRLIPLEELFAHAKHQTIRIIESGGESYLLRRAADKG